MPLRSKYRPISILVSLIIISVLSPLSCAEQITDKSHELPQATSSESIIVVAVGDVMLSRLVGERIKMEGDPKAPFLKTAEILEKADIAFCNLESPFYDEESLPEEWMVFSDLFLTGKRGKNTNDYERYQDRNREVF